MTKRLTDTERAAKIADRFHLRLARLANQSGRAWLKTGDELMFNSSAARGMAAWIAKDIAAAIRAEGKKRESLRADKKVLSRRK